MNYSSRTLVFVSFLVFTIGGCESCQRTTTPEGTGGSAPTAKKPEPTKSGAAVPQQPAAALPTPAPQMGVTAPVGNADPNNDCFVFVDAEPDYGDAPMTAVFSTDMECGNKPVTYSWDFGDGTKGGNEATPSHAYTKAGDYIATVTVTTADGAEGSDEIDIFVDEPGGD